MSSKLHDKWHRHNHHTYASSIEPDAGHDPIASPMDSFKGDFHLTGQLSAYAPLSAAAGVFQSNYTGVSASGEELGAYSYGTTGGTFFASATSSTYDLSAADTTTEAGLYCYGYADDAGPFGLTIEYVRGYIPKALIVDGYADMRWPVFAQSLYSHYISTDYLVASSMNVPLITASNAFFDSLTANTFYVTTIVSTTTSTTTTTATSFSTTSLSGGDIYGGYIHQPARGTVAVTLSASSTIPQNVWTLVPMDSARWDPFSKFTVFGTVKPGVDSICICELDMIAHPLSGTSLGIVAGITTNTTMSAVTADPDSQPKVFYGGWFNNNGVTYTKTTGVSGVSIHGTTLVDVNGTNDEIGIYVYNADGQTVVDYAKLRVVVLGQTM